MSFLNEISTKPYEALPDIAKEEIHLVSYNKDIPPAVVGSYGYRVQKYPADIDLMESVDQIKVYGTWHPATDPVELAEAFAKKIKNVIRDIQHKPLHHLLDFKAGIDPRYHVVLGKMENGVLSLDEKFIPTMIELTEAGYYSTTEFKAIYDLAASGNDQRVYDGLTKLLRAHYVLRWSAEEIIKGKKTLPLGAKITLVEAILQKQLVKMDISAFVGDRLMEVSNIWTFMFLKADGSYQNITPLPSLDNVPFDIEKLFWSDMYFSPFKVVKRIFSYSRLMYLKQKNSYKGQQFEKILRQTVGFISGDTSLMYQMRSEIETMLALHEMKIPLGEKITRQINGFKNRIFSDVRLDEKSALLLTKMVDEFLLSGQRTKDFSILEMLSKALKSIINERAIQFLINVNMDPPPNIVLPTTDTATRLTMAGLPINPFCPVQYQKTYNWSVSRSVLMKNTIKGAGRVRRKKAKHTSYPITDTALKLAEIFARHYFNSRKGSGISNENNGYEGEDGALIRIRPALDPEDLARMRLSHMLRSGGDFIPNLPYNASDREILDRAHLLAEQGICASDCNDYDADEICHGYDFDCDITKVPISEIERFQKVLGNKSTGDLSFGRGFCDCPKCAQRGYHGSGCSTCGGRMANR